MEALLICNFSNSQPVTRLLRDSGHMATSDHCRGFVRDGPLLLVQGFGPIFYKELVDKWNEIVAKQISEYSQEATKWADILAKHLHAYSSSSSLEAVWTGFVSMALRRLINTLSSYDGFEVIHQVSTNAAGEAADHCIADVMRDVLSIHAVLEMKWVDLLDLFPEMQGSVYASKFDKQNPETKGWMPVFSLSQSHLRIGVAFSKTFPVWAYVDIFSTSIVKDCSLHLLHFVDFMCNAAKSHKEWVVNDSDSFFVDSSGSKLLNDCMFIGNRVIVGMDEADMMKTMKFYPTAESVIKALDAQRQGFGVLKYPEFKAKQVIGCGSSAVGAILDDYIETTLRVSKGHLIDLVEQVDMLYSAGWVHGDLREDNILYTRSGKVKLIDFDWSGKVGVAKFPSNVNVHAFGRFSRKYINPLRRIPKDFDYYCLYQVLKNAGLLLAADFACDCDKDGVMQSIRNSDKAPAQLRRRSVEAPNFSLFGPRLERFYHTVPSNAKSESSSDGSAKKRKSVQSGSAGSTQ